MEDQKSESKEINDEALKKHLGQNAEFVIDLVLRVGALEKLLISKGILLEDEIQTHALATYKSLLVRAQEMQTEVPEVDLDKKDA